MRLTIIGSTGRTGRHVLAEAGHRGHQITAFTRHADQVPELRALPCVSRALHGDGRDPQAMRDAIAGADTVIAIVGAARRKGPHHTAEVAAVITETMTELGIPRLVITSAYPIVATSPRLAIALLNRILADAYADMKAMEQIVTASDVGWRIARLNRHTDAPARGGTRITSGLLDKPTVLTRADAAAALLDISQNPALARAAVNIAGPR